MKRIGLAVLLITLVFAAGCAKKQGKTVTKNGTEWRSYYMKYWGYKRAVKINADPAAVEAYLLDPSHLVSASKSLKLKMSGAAKMEKRGDTAIYKSTYLAVPMTISVTLWDLDPGKETFLICLVNESTVGFIHYHLRKLEDGTRFEFEFEVEQNNPLMENLVETLNLGQIIMRLQDETVDRMQAHFNPDLREEQAAEGTVKGENFTKLYQDDEVSVRINASPEKVWKYLVSPAFTEMVKEKYKVDLGKTFTEGKSGGIYLFSASLFGTRRDSQLFLLNFGEGKPLTAYLTGRLPCRIQLIIRPAGTGTELFLSFMTMPPSAFSAEVADALSNSSLIANAIGRVELDVKQAVEGAI